MTRDQSSSLVAGLLLTVVALVLRVHGLGWGLPEVYEEATPLHRAWAMWNGGATAFDPNPHFFNYPSLMIYLHLLWQGLQMVAFKAVGLIGTSLDYRVMVEVEKTPVYYAARLLTALFGTGTVILVWRLGRRLAGPTAGLGAAFLLAINTFHIDQSQLIAVDVPLAFLATAALAAMLRLERSARLRDHLWVGLWIGLATSAKYTGAMLIVPYVAAHFLVTPPGDGTGFRGHARLLSAGLVATGVVFALTSPFVVIDLKAALRSLSVERDHMQQGHFGLQSGRDALFYLRHLSGRLLGWPALLGALGGAWFWGWRQRRPMVAVLALFLVANLWPISSWNMRADRYALPVLPTLTVLAGAGIGALVALANRRRWSRGLAMTLGLAAAVLMAIPSVRAYPALLVRSQPDTRTTALRWIESHIPAGSFVLAEYLGPDLLRPTTLMPLDPELQDRLLTGASRRPVYAVQMLPLFQSRPELAAVYYDLKRYPDADYVLISGSVRSRYVQDPARFSRQLAFYKAVEDGWEKVKGFEPDHGTGPRLTLYRNPLWQEPYAERDGSPPALLPPAPSGLARDEGFHYFSLGANAMRFGHPAHAEQAFRLGLGYGPLRPEIARNLVVGVITVMSEAGRGPEAAAFLDSLATAGQPEVQEAIAKLRGAPLSR